MATFTSESSGIETHPGQRLHRSTTDRLCCGVCAGVAEYLSVDPSLIRLAFVAGTLWGGIGLLLYIVLAIVLPTEEQSPVRTPISSERSRMAAGLLLVAVGGILLAANMGWAPWLGWSLFWPGVLVLVGLGLLLRDPRTTTT
jgi:phage shock protein C